MMERGFEIKVLDHGYVRLVDYMGSDEAIVEAARMSTGRGFVSWEPYRRCKSCQTVSAGVEGPCERPARFIQHGELHEPGACLSTEFEKFPRGDLGLLETMYKNKHSTPFEFGTLHIEVQAPLMVFREWHRHRTWGYSEFSARYSQMPDLHYLPELSRIQRQSMTNRQGSGEAFDESFARRVTDMFRDHQEMLYIDYQSNINFGVAKEVARLNTPVSRYSKMRGIVNLRNALAFLILRKAPAAQYEIRQYADAVGEMVKSIWPRTYALFEEHDLNGVHLSQTEVRQILGAMHGKGPDAVGLDDKGARALVAKLEAAAFPVRS